MFCRSLFVFLSFFFLSLFCLSFFDLRILINHFSKIRVGIYNYSVGMVFFHFISDCIFGVKTESTEKESVNWKVNLIMTILIPVIYYRILTSCQVLHHSAECVICLSHQKFGVRNVRKDFAHDAH
jgi:hypothetical protein